MRLQYTQKVTVGTQDSRLPLVSVPQLIGLSSFPLHAAGRSPRKLAAVN